MTVETKLADEKPNGVKELSPTQDVDGDAEEGEEDAVADGGPTNGKRLSGVLANDMLNHPQAKQRKRRKRSPRRRRLRRAIRLESD